MHSIKKVIGSELEYFDKNPEDAFKIPCSPGE